MRKFRGFESGRFLSSFVRARTDYRATSRVARRHASCDIMHRATSRIAMIVFTMSEIDQFRYINIQPNTTDLSTGLWGINPRASY